LILLDSCNILSYFRGKCKKELTKKRVKGLIMTPSTNVIQRRTFLVLDFNTPPGMKEDEPKIQFIESE
jgi:hypothetical protein